MTSLGIVSPMMRILFSAGDNCLSMAKSCSFRLVPFGASLFPKILSCLLRLGISKVLNHYVSLTDLFICYNIWCVLNFSYSPTLPIERRSLWRIGIRSRKYLGFWLPSRTLLWLAFLENCNSVFRATMVKYRLAILMRLVLFRMMKNMLRQVALPSLTPVILCKSFAS